MNHEKNLFEKTNLEKYDDLDFIVTNSIDNEFTEYNEILKSYSNNQFKHTKSALAFKGLDDVLETS